MREILRQGMINALASDIAPYTLRAVRLPAVKRKAHAVIGVRRGGKTTFLKQCMDQRLKAGAARETQVMLGFEDDRLIGIDAADLSWLLEEYFALYPQLRGITGPVFYLDEIQLVPGWEGFVRRVMDTEQIEVFVSGSSAKMLSREVATSLRGRALETVILPFSFREVLRHTGDEPQATWSRLASKTHSGLHTRLRKYLIEGGFPEAQGLETTDRLALLRSYVDVVLLRDVLERHSVSQPVALRWLQRQLLSNPAATFTIEKSHNAMKSQGISISKDTLHAFLEHFQDAFLIYTTTISTGSERRRMINPRKAYPIDPSLITLFERSGRPNTGHALETVVMLELVRRGYDVSYALTHEGWEVDFHVQAPGLPELLIQVSDDVSEASTLAREVRALAAAAGEHPHATALLITLSATPPREDLPSPLRWTSATAFLLGDE
jgi:uncharacterized protein